MARRETARERRENQDLETLPPGRYPALLLRERGGELVLEGFVTGFPSSPTRFVPYEWTMKAESGIADGWYWLEVRDGEETIHAQLVHLASNPALLPGTYQLTGDDSS